MRFEKWQALGNDYLIFEAGSLPFALTPARIERICDVHTGVGSDGILLLSEPDEPGFVDLMAHLAEHGSDGFVVAGTTGEAPTLPALVDFLQARGVAAYKLPDRLAVVDELPLTAVGKIDKKELARTIT